MKNVGIENVTDWSVSQIHTLNPTPKLHGI